MKRELVIGDIHGGLRALMQVMERAGVTVEDVLIFLGDYVDGWSESADVVEYLLQLEKQQHCIFLKGNHDVWCEDWLRTGIVDPKWLLRGGAATLESYASRDIAFRHRHLAFFERMQFYMIDPNNCLFIHAGFVSDKGPQEAFDQPPYVWDRSLWQEAIGMGDLKPGDANYPVRLSLFREIFIGHTPTINFGSSEPVCAGNLWNIDTGSAFYGPLSIMDVQTHQFWQSDPVMMLYPDEDGRGRTKQH